MISKTGLAKYALPLFFIASSIVGCGATPDGAEEDNVGSLKDEIVDGTPVSPPDIHVRLSITDSTGTYLCSGTLVNDRWVVTAKHCGTRTGSTVYRGSDTRSVVQVVDHPSLDVTLARVDSAVPDVYVTSMYPWSTSTLAGKTVTCYGYGINKTGPATDGSQDTGEGTLRKGTMYVGSSPTSTSFTVWPPQPTNVTPGPGDSGGGCFSTWAKSTALLGVLSTGSRSGSTIFYGTYIPTSAFSQWALPYIAPAGHYLACHGRECITNPSPLPNNVSQEEAWRPCPGQLTAPGGYSFGYDVQYNFLSGDGAWVNAEWLVGAGSKSGTSNASHLGNQLKIYTNGIGQSTGVTWLRARCPGDPT
jgi:hypothetical protein